MKSKMTIGRKLILVFGAMVALTLGLAYSSLATIGNLSASLDTAVNRTARKMELTGEILRSVEQLRTAQRGVILYSVLKEPAVVDKAKDMFASNSARLERLLAELKPLLVTEEGRQAADTIHGQSAAWQPMYQAIVRMSAAGQFDDKLNDTVNKTLVNFEPMVKSAERLQELIRAIEADETKGAAEISSHSRRIAGLLIVVCLALGGVGILIVRQISKALRRVAEEMADGAEQVASASGQVSSSSQALAQGASEQAASLEETSASTEEIHSMTQKNATNSQSATEFMSEAANRIEQANQVVDQMVASMKEINASSDKVAKIIKVIDEIAFQTNILALNAAVEAARAGEAGMGFAVVADEVRNLAQRCAQAAKDTAALIEESIATTNEGKTKLDQVTAAIHSTTESANAVKTLVDEVNHGSQEQARGIEQIAKAVTQMEQVTQKTAASAEESASASEELSAQAETMRKIVEELQGMVDGGETGLRPGSGRGPEARILSGPNQRRTRDVSVRHAATARKGAADISRSEEMLVSRNRPDKSAIPLDDEFKEF